MNTSEQAEATIKVAQAANIHISDRVWDPWSMIGMGSSVGLTAFPMGYYPNDSSFPYAHDTGHVLGAWFALLVMIAIFGALTTYFLKRKDRLGR